MWPVGEELRFGWGGSGAAPICRHRPAMGLAGDVLPMLWDGEERVSSSRIRAPLAAGHISEATRLLGAAPYASAARWCAAGAGRGLGWPTRHLQVDGRNSCLLKGATPPGRRLVLAACGLST